MKNMESCHGKIYLLIPFNLQRVEHALANIWLDISECMKNLSEMIRDSGLSTSIEILLLQLHTGLFLTVRFKMFT